MDKNVSRLLSLVNQLLDFRKTEIEGYRLNFVRTEEHRGALASIFRLRIIHDRLYQRRGSRSY